MVKTPKPFSSDEQRAANGCQSINSFFTTKNCDGVSRGRRAQQRGKKRRASAATAAAAAADANDVGGHDDTRARTKEARKQKKQREMDVSVTVLKKGKEHNKAPSKKKPYEPSSTSPPTTTDWTLPENAAKLKPAVEGWLNKDKSTYDDRDPNKKLSFRRYASKMGIPESTLRAYTHKDPNKRKSLGAKPGRPSVVKSEVSDFVAQLAVRSDRANDGMTLADTRDAISELQPDLSEKQVANYASRTFFTTNKDMLKRPVIAQATTTKRSCCTVEEQFRWFNQYEDALNFMRQNNTGRCRRTGKTFGELIIHFIVGGDESGFIANADGVIRVVGDRSKSKHEKNCADSRSSITLYRTGCVAGNNGPTAFIMAGKKRRTGFTDKFLMDHGCEVGSTIAMTETAFMTKQAWEEITPSLIKGYRAMQVVCDNPDWWMLEIVDGFTAHVESMEALQVSVISLMLMLNLLIFPSLTNHIC